MLKWEDYVQTNSMVRKYLAVGIILLFIGVAVAPSISANNGDELLKIKQSLVRKVFPVTRYEYKPDGSIEKTTIRLSQRECLQLNQALSFTTSLEEKIEVCKKYSVLPPGASLQKIKSNFNQSLIVRKINITAIQNYVRNHNLFRFFGITLNSMCSVFISTVKAIRFNYGMNAILRYFNVLILIWGFITQSFNYIYIPGIDLFDCSLSVLANAQTANGILPNSSMYLSLCLMMMVGFVGYAIDLTLLPFITYLEFFVGYTAFILALGLNY
jgi:hypothetical protein